jgi:putative transposase
MKSISIDLWIEIEKILPIKIKKVGRPEFNRLKAFNGILYILKNGSLWKDLPEKYGCASTVHGKFMKWSRLGIFEKILKIARKYYMKKNKNHLWYAFDTLLKKAPFAKFGGKNPTDRSKRGIKQTILVDKKGAPLFVNIYKANIHDSKLLKQTVKKLSSLKRSRIIAADSAFDAGFLYKICKSKNIILDAATNIRRNKKKQKYKPANRWIVERTFGWLSWFRGLKTCWAKSKISHLSFLQLGCSIQLFKMSGIFG